MADELGLDALLAIERLLEGKDHQHPVDVLLDELDAVLLPGPQLRADEVDDGNAEAVELFGQAEVDFGEVDEHGDAGWPLPDGLLEFFELAVDAGQMEDDLGEAHDGHVFGADDALQAGGSHARAAHAEEGGCPAGGGELPLKRVDQQGAILLAAGLACRDEDGGGHCLRLHSRIPRWRPS